MKEKSKVQKVVEARLIDKITGSKEVPDDTLAFRAGKCNSCSYMKDNKCSLCTCPIDAKTSKAGEVCALLTHLNQTPLWNKLEVQIVGSDNPNLYNTDHTQANVGIDTSGKRYFIDFSEVSKYKDSICYNFQVRYKKESKVLMSVSGCPCITIHTNITPNFIKHSDIVLNIDLKDLSNGVHIKTLTMYYQQNNSSVLGSKIESRKIEVDVKFKLV